MLKLSERWSEFFPLCWRFLSSLKCKVEILSSYEYSTKLLFLFTDSFSGVFMLPFICFDWVAKALCTTLQMLADMLARRTDVILQSGGQNFLAKMHLRVSVGR